MDSKASRGRAGASGASKRGSAGLAVGGAVDANTPRFRSGAVARMLRMPVATLRIWERRYAVSAPALTPAQHRLYSSADVQRLALLRQLTELGHAIGAIATLDMDGLRRVAATHAGLIASARQAAPPRLDTWRVAVAGPALARRLRQPGFIRRLGLPLEIVADVATPMQAAPAGAVPVDLLLLEVAGLHEDLLAAAQAAARAWGAKATALLYGFAPQKAIDAFAGAGIALWRQPQDDRALAASVSALCAAAGASAPDPSEASAGTPLWMSVGDVTPRRYDDATLADFAGLSSTIACECPRHVADLLVQLSQFEAYSADCQSRDAKDAALHAYLARVAGASRALFEAALQRIAIEEGLVLPGDPPQSAAAGAAAAPV